MSDEAPLARGGLLDLTIERLAFGGDAVAHAPDGRVVFVRGVGPGDRVRARLVQVRRRHLRAVVEERLADGPERVEPFCAVQAKCGGCPWQGVALKTQRAALVDHVERLLARAVGAPVTVPLADFGDGRAWRSTTRLHWEDGALGYRAPRATTVLDVASCPVLAPPLPALLADVRRLLGPFLLGKGTLRLTAAHDADSGTVHLSGQVRGLASAVERLVETSPWCHGAVIDGPRPRSFGDPADRLGPARVPHPTGGFAQAHQPGSGGLVAAAVDAVGPPTRVLELYAGAGNFTVALALAGHHVTAVERDGPATASLEALVAARRLSVVVAPGDADRPPEGDFPVALIDPPRAGAAAAVRALQARGVRRLVYVACDPATLARDVGWLVAEGWRLDSARAFDLFPHTGHAEVLATLSRAA